MGKITQSLRGQNLGIRRAFLNELGNFFNFEQLQISQNVAGHNAPCSLESSDFFEYFIFLMVQSETLKLCL
jgi:hypothetical protein